MHVEGARRSKTTVSYRIPDVMYRDRHMVCHLDWGEEASLARAKDFYVRGWLSLNGLRNWVETITRHFAPASDA